jgi:ankyrin repeat protein
MEIESKNSTALMAAVSDSNIAIAMLFLQHGHGQKNINEWFNINKISITGRIAFYQHILTWKPQHQPLLDFHMCRLHVRNAPDHQESSLRIFSNRWPEWVGHTIESFVLPSKQARQTMEQVRMRFVSTLNDRGKNGLTSLCQAILQFDVDAVTFLLQQNGIEVNKTSYESSPLFYGQRTPLTIVATAPSFNPFMDITEKQNPQENPQEKQYVTCL